MSREPDKKRDNSSEEVRAAFVRRYSDPSYLAEEQRWFERHQARVEESEMLAARYHARMEEANQQFPYYRALVAASQQAPEDLSYRPMVEAWRHVSQGHAPGRTGLLGTQYYARMRDSDPDDHMSVALASGVAGLRENGGFGALALAAAREMFGSEAGRTIARLGQVSIQASRGAFPPLARNAFLRWDLTGHIPYAEALRVSLVPQPGSFESDMGIIFFETEHDAQEVDAALERLALKHFPCDSLFDDGYMRLSAHPLLKPEFERWWADAAKQVIYDVITGGSLGQVRDCETRAWLTDYLQRTLGGVFVSYAFDTRRQIQAAGPARLEAPTNPEQDIPDWVPRKPKGKKAMREQWQLMQKLDREYQGLYDSGDTENPKPKAGDYITYLKSKGHRANTKTPYRVRRAVEEGWI